MLGYYLPGDPGILHPPEAGWHDTGDIVAVDGDGYVKILGRAKRFAKIAGEMVSLTLVESMAHAVWPAAQSVAIAIPDTRKGERIVLVTTQADADRAALSTHASKNGITGLSVPASIIHVAKMPLLGTGKTDYSTVQEIVKDRLEDAA